MSLSPLSTCSQALLKAKDWDIENGDEFAYTSLLDRVKNGEFQGCLLGTFSGARREDDGGPRPLRLPDCIYADAKKSIQSRSRRARCWRNGRRRCSVFLLTKTSRPSWRSPRPREAEGAVSMFDFDEFKALLERTGVSLQYVFQCAYGAPSSRPTAFMNLAWTSEMSGKCASIHPGGGD